MFIIRSLLVIQYIIKQISGVTDLLKINVREQGTHGFVKKMPQKASMVKDLVLSVNNFCLF